MESIYIQKIIKSALVVWPIGGWHPLVSQVEQPLLLVLLLVLALVLALDPVLLVSSRI